MRRVITGHDAQGRSTVLSDGAPPTVFRATSTTSLDKVAPEPLVSPPPAGEGFVHELWALDNEPVKGSQDPTPAIAAAVFDAPPGATKWIITELGPGVGAAMHHTPTIDYGVIVAGEVEMGLETGNVVLRAGDTVFVDGVEHSWRAGPEGCVIATVLVGLRADDR
jgi:quercetin dioxygenase-like cupin family protein